MGKLVTAAQADAVRTMANEKKVGREAFDRLLKDGSISRLLDSVRPNTDQIVKFTRQLYSNLPLGATDGMATFRSAGFYIYYMDSRYRSAVVQATQPIKVSGYELTKNATFMEFLGAFGEGRARWKNEAQIVQFCRDHRDKLREDGYANFFELEGGFVAHVSVYDDGKLGVNVYPLGRDLTWRSNYRHRVFSPQQ